MRLKSEDKRKKKEKEKKKKKAQADIARMIAAHYSEAELAANYTRELDTVIFHLKKILNINHQEKKALGWLAEIYFNLQQYDEAAYYFSRLKMEREDWIDLEFYLGLSYYLSKTRMDLARENLEGFLAKTKGDRTEAVFEKRNKAIYYLNNIMQKEIRPIINYQPKPVSPAKAKPKLLTAQEKAALKPSKEALPETTSPEQPFTAVTALLPMKIEDYKIKANFSFSAPTAILERIRENKIEDKSLYDLRLEFHHLSLLRGYDELLCLETLHQVDHYWYQIETVKRVLKYYRGRVLLADEVGLGKTIEAGMLIKEYLLRGLINRVLILTPSSLVSQWHEELSGKFGLEFVTTDQDIFRSQDSFWTDHPLIIASINVAKSKKYFEKITQMEHDLVVVDEAHHMRNRTTLNWKLVNALKKKFIFLISATPVQNNLIELFNLITLLKPGFLKTESEFRKKYMVTGKPKVPKDSETLRQLLREIMIRNTRSLIDVKLPPRFASTIMVTPSDLEKQIYQAVSSLVREGYEQGMIDRLSLANLLMKAGSSFFSLEESLSKLQGKVGVFSGRIDEIFHLLSQLQTSEKEKRLADLLKKKPGEKKIIFTHFHKTMDSLTALLKREGISFTSFSGDLSNAEKDRAIEDFRQNIEVLLSTEVGGEGRNIQFCRTIINYDLPWNPMRIEQRIGRIHRIGQTNDVFIFNFCLKESIEEYILEILDKKINMFELVVGEIDNILGNLDEEAEFSDLVMNIWVQAKTKEELSVDFSNLGDKMIQAKKEYLESKELDESLLATDFEV